MPTLDADNPRDDLLIEILEEQFCNPLTIAEINQRLLRNGYPELDLIDHRTTKKVASERKSSPFKLLKKQVRTFTDDLLLGDQYVSLATQYDTFRYRCVAEMWLEDTVGHKGYKLSAATSERYSLDVYSKENGLSDLKSFKTIDEAGAFADYFLELEAMAKREYKKMLDILNDTKNYQERISANILNDNLHVFVETYNYTVPELNEYYLLEYIDGIYRLSVFSNSKFMHYYLGSKKYEDLYGNKDTTPLAVYSSLAEIEELESSSRHDVTFLLKYRKRMFKRLQNKVDNLIDELRERKVYIQHLDHIFDDWDRVCFYYNVKEKFQCTLDSEYGDMMSAGIDHADFTLPDQSSVTITLKDLYRAFELGFNNIEEICRVKRYSGSIESILPQ